MRRDPSDRRAGARNAVSFLASLLLHALAAYLLFSLATSSSEQSATESYAGAVMVSVSRAAPQRRETPKPKPVQSVPPRVRPVPVLAAPGRPVKPHRVRQRAVPPHPRVLHELAKFAPTAPPNPTPAPVSTVQPQPAPTQAPLAATPLPLQAPAPTAAPISVAAVSVRTPPTAAPTPEQRPTPQPRPSSAPRPTSAPATPQPEPSALEATAAPLAAVTTPVPLITPGSPAVRVAQVRPAATPAHGTAPTPGPKASASPGPHGVAPIKGPSVARPIQALPATPAPAAVHLSKRAAALTRRLQSLIPTEAPSTQPPAAPSKRYSFLNIKVTPEPEPTPPPDVVAATKYLYVENVAGQRWKQSILGTAPEERYVKMYVTGVKRIGFINWCTGWAVRAPIAGSSRWIVEPHASFICSGHLEPFTQPSPEPPDGS